MTTQVDLENNVCDEIWQTEIITACVYLCIECKETEFTERNSERQNENY